jgi:hypothetical protein
MLVTISIVTEKIRNFVLTKVQRGIHDTPWEESTSANDFYDGYSGEFQRLVVVIHVKSTLIFVYHLYGF